MLLYKHLKTISVCYFNHHQFDMVKSKKGKVEWVFFTNCHASSDCQMYTFWTFRKDSFGRRKRQKKEGKIYLMFYGLIKRKSLLLLTVEKKSSINIETTATRGDRHNCASQDNNISVSVIGFLNFNDSFQIELMIQ